MYIIQKTGIQFLTFMLDIALPKMRDSATDGLAVFLAVICRNMVLIRYFN